jgi:hypothetical protein
MCIHNMFSLFRAIKNEFYERDRVKKEKRNKQKCNKHNNNYFIWNIATKFAVRISR